MRKDIAVGGSWGIGKATAQCLINKGHWLSIVARNMPKWEGDFDFYKCDALKYYFVEKLYYQSFSILNRKIILLIMNW